ncbi:MAG: response regulator, partial [Deltaproteobacteria bacterium]|jgi:signal transduction histidine kinase/CheY-like chemotaxis protein|nr:response regulator [Deltaproteobacteria bacterium]
VHRYFLPDATPKLWWADLYWGFVQLVVAAKCFHTARGLEANYRRAWLCFGLGILAYALGTFLWSWYELGAHVLSPIPSWSDVLFLAMSPLFLAGIWFYCNRSPSRGVTLIQLGNLGIIVFALLIAHTFFFFDILQWSQNTALSVTTVGYALSSTTVFFYGLASTLFYLASPQRAVMIPILLAGATLALADNMTAYWLVSGDFSSTDAFNAVYLLPFAFICWSAFEEDHLDDASRSRALLSQWESRALQWESLLSPISVALVLAVMTFFDRGTHPQVLPYTASVLVPFVAIIAAREWWVQRVQNQLRSQALASEASLQESEKHLLVKNAELAMANSELWDEMRKRLEAQEDLRQAQKMEALGQLTGGIAHDFNNLLAVIIGNLELLEQRARGDSDLTDLLGDVAKAADRGAALTQRLLSFSRKQALSPTSIDGASLLDGMTGLIESTLGNEIQIEIRVDDGLWNCNADRLQLETALLNLVWNARDAMQDGGELAIDVSNVTIEEAEGFETSAKKAGQYVLFRVRDSGGGMPTGIQEKVFEPFFTTKELGAGTGLGLSMVYGFAKQSGGHVEISSEEGAGTEVRIYIPRCWDSAEESDSVASSSAQHGRGETLLVVEDEPQVRRLVVRMLTDLGYNVVQAGDGNEAQRLLENLDPLDLMLSDVVLADGITGTDLAKRARELRPQVKILLMSGFAGEHLAAADPVELGAEFIHKPFRKIELAEILRALLDAPTTSMQP